VRADFKRVEKLTTLPDSIGDLGHLEEIDIYGTNLNALPESLGRLENLRTLYLECNVLTTLPKSVGNLKQLTHLSVQGNRLKVLPQSLVELTHLRYLNLINNRLKTLPGFHFVLFPHLYVAIRGNPAAASLDAVRELGIPAADVVVCPKCETLVSEVNVRHVIDDFGKYEGEDHYTCPCGEELVIEIKASVPPERTVTHSHDPPCGCSECRDLYPEYYRELETQQKREAEENVRKAEEGDYRARIKDRGALATRQAGQVKLDRWQKKR
jgi:hypothetical protein